MSADTTGPDLREQITGAVMFVVGPKLAERDDRIAELEAGKAKLTATIAAFPDAGSAANLAHARAERDHFKATLDEVRRLCVLTIEVSCRVQAVEQAVDTLAILDGRGEGPKP